MRKLNVAILNAITYVLALAFFYPVLWIFMTGFKPEAEAVEMPPSFIFSPTLDNYREVLNVGVGAFLANSFIITVASTLIALLLGVPAAYALAMFNLKKGENILFWFMSTKFLPAVGVIVPVYLIFKNLNLLDSHIALILLYAAMNIPLVIWMMRSFFKDIPYDVIEAYQIDGATGLQGFFKVTLPIAKAGLVSTMLLCMVFAWNEFFFTVTLTYTKAGTMPIYMASYMSKEGLFWAKMSAVASMSILPTVLLGWYTQNSLVRGMTMGAVKG